MSIEKTLSPNARVTILEVGRFLYIRKASAALSITLTSDVDQGQSVEIKMHRGEQYDIGEFSPTARFTRLEIQNLSSQRNDIELEIGLHRFTPSIAGSDINATITASRSTCLLRWLSPLK